MITFTGRRALLVFTERVRNWFVVHPFYKVHYDILYKSTVLEGVLNKSQ